MSETKMTADTIAEGRRLVEARLAAWNVQATKPYHAEYVEALRAAREWLFDNALGLLAAASLADSRGKLLEGYVKKCEALRAALRCITNDCGDCEDELHGLEDASDIADRMMEIARAALATGGGG